MAKSIYCSLLLVVSCLIYEAYGNGYAVRYVTLPPRKISDNIDPYDSSSPYSSSPTAAAEANGAEADSDEASESAATSLSPSSPLKKSFSLKNSLEYDRNRGLGLQNSKSQHGKYHKQQSNYMDSDDLNNENIQNSMNSDYQDFPNSKNMNQFDRRTVRQNSWSPSSNVDHSQPISQPNNPMFTTLSNGNSDFMTKWINKQFKSFGQNSLSSVLGNIGDFQRTGNPTNMQSGSIRYSTIIPSSGSSNEMGPYNMIPYKRKSINYPRSDPVGLSKNEANKIRNQVLQKSNLYREKHNLDPFTLDDQLNNCAQDWANQMAKSNIFDHRQNNEYGENLYSSSKSNNLGEKAVDSWYNEIISFNIDDDEDRLFFNTPTHHMTQLLWGSSTKLGVGVSKNPNGMYNVVANYNPSGNERGSFKQNLPNIKQEDIEEAKKSQKSQRELEQQQGINWSLRSTFPMQSEWNYGPYFN